MFYRPFNMTKSNQTHCDWDVLPASSAGRREPWLAQTLLVDLLGLWHWGWALDCVCTAQTDAVIHSLTTWTKKQLLDCPKTKQQRDHVSPWACRTATAGGWKRPQSRHRRCCGSRRCCAWSGFHPAGCLMCTLPCPKPTGKTKQSRSGFYIW